jgi:hypothetical protein
MNFISNIQESNTLKRNCGPTTAAPLDNLVIKNNFGFGFYEKIPTLSLPVFTEK